MTDREVLPGCARVRTKCAEKTSVDLRGQSRDPRELPGVIGSVQGWAGVLQIDSSPCQALVHRKWCYFGKLVGFHPCEYLDLGLSPY